MASRILYKPAAAALVAARQAPAARRVFSSTPVALKHKESSGGKQWTPLQLNPAPTIRL